MSQWPTVTVTMTHIYDQMTVKIIGKNDQFVSPGVWLVGSWFLDKNDRLDRLIAVVTQWLTVTVNWPILWLNDHDYHSQKWLVRFSEYGASWKLFFGRTQSSWPPRCSRDPMTYCDSGHSLMTVIVSQMSLPNDQNDLNNPQSPALRYHRCHHYTDSMRINDFQSLDNPWLMLGTESPVRFSH